MIDRRAFVKAGSTSIAALALSPQLALPEGTRGSEHAVGRLTLPMNRNWRFSPRRADQDTARHFNDTTFERVTVPHTNHKVAWHSFDEKTYQFISIYRRHFTLPRVARGQHVFIDFEGAMAASTVWINGHRLGEYRGGYTPFSFELTPHVDWDHENVLAVELDSTERPDIPPFGGTIDYLTFGGIYREVALRCVPSTHLDNVFARPVNVLSDHPGVDVSCFVAHLATRAMPLTLEVELRDKDRVLASARTELASVTATLEPEEHKLTLSELGPVQRWDLEKPTLYTVVARIRQGTAVIDEDQRRIGFREARFTDHGFELNGRIVKLRGLNRHQTFPWVGQAMPARVQRRDAVILKKELKLNIVRTSHYPQSRHFLDACDELGLLVLEEIPGWQHTGDKQWQDLAVDNVGRMIRRDWNHPSIILWGVRINEANDNHDFYVRTNALAHRLDPSRQTGGVRNHYQSELLEDVFTNNDFGFPLDPPNHPLYLNTEFVGHTFPAKPYDHGSRLAEQSLRHARIHNQLGSMTQYAGGIGWCAFDYNTHAAFGGGDRMCYHGVSDIFRLPKPAASFYRAQCDPTDEIVLEPAFQWAARADWSAGLEGSEEGSSRPMRGLIWSNCERIAIHVDEKSVVDVEPDRENFPHLPHPPFFVDRNRLRGATLRMEGYLGPKVVIERTYNVDGVDREFMVVADDDVLNADGADTTRVVMRVTDEFGSLRRYSTAAISLTLEGPAELVGDNPFSLVGGGGAVWIRAREQAGKVVLRASHPVLGTRSVSLQIRAAERERV
ncbi:MAG: glycoside hydrolase family 2 TIM barrel-domain containing protein [bacterium]